MTAETFAFSEINPTTSTPFARCRFRDLPAYVAEVVVETLHLCSGEWNDLVQHGEVYDYSGEDDRYPVNRAARPRAEDDDTTWVVMA
jgi:hypothetical protein